MSRSIEGILARFETRHVAVIGDFMLDEYVWGNIDRISPEAPVPILKILRSDVTLGGAGNVAKNVRALGGRVSALGVVGRDAVGGTIVRMLDELGVNHQGVLSDPERPSTHKVRLMSLEHGQQVFRMDEEATRGLESVQEQRLIDELESLLTSVHAVLCSDYLKGVLTPRVLRSICEMARKHNVPVVVAPKDSDPLKYCGVTALVPNAKELSQLSKVAIDGNGWAAGAARLLVRQLDAECLLVTLGSGGMSLFERSGHDIVQSHIPTVARAVYDVTGAGDTVVSVFTLALAAGERPGVAAWLANLAAGIVVGKRGTASVSVEELLDRAAGTDQVPCDVVDAACVAEEVRLGGPRASAPEEADSGMPRRQRHHAGRP